jgi:hypothetical protein
MRTCEIDDDHDDVDSDRCLTRTDPIVVKMVFEVDELSEGKEGLTMRGSAHPGVQSGKLFGCCAPRNGVLKEQIDGVIKREANWLRNFYPLRPLKMDITRPDVRQITLSEAVL